MMRTSRSGVAFALGLGSKRLAQSPPKPGSKPQHTTGSSEPAPKGTTETEVLHTAAAPAHLRDTGCGGFPAKHNGLSDTSVPELRKLAQYEQLCGGAVAARTSIFVPTPSTVAQAQSSAQTVAATLKAYASEGISPLVFMEPTDLSGVQLDLTAYAGGTYDAALAAYFQALQTIGITSAGMGMWVYLPEGNLPVWSTTDPVVYTAVVTRMARLQKQYFPGSQVSVLLDSQTFPAGRNWGGGSYTSLMPYVQDIPVGLIDSFGLQGFPWAAPANRPGEASVYNPETYLRADLAAQAAHALGTKNIWFNTGTFSQMYAKRPEQTVTASPLQRQQMLDGVLRLARQTQAQGFTVAVHLFAQNKSAWNEATDWSYWQRTPGDRADSAVFTTFAHDAQADCIAIWLYDSY